MARPSARGTGAALALALALLSTEARSEELPWVRAHVDANRDLVGCTAAGCRILAEGPFDIPQLAEGGRALGAMRLACVDLDPEGTHHEVELAEELLVFAAGGGLVRRVPIAAFANGFTFWEHGTQLVVCEGPRYGAGWCRLQEISSGVELARVGPDEIASCPWAREADLSTR